MKNLGWRLWLTSVVASASTCFASFSYISATGGIENPNIHKQLAAGVALVSLLVFLFCMWLPQDRSDFGQTTLDEIEK